MARVLGLVAPLIAQPVSKGALSTLYTATAPELAGALSLTGAAPRALRLDCARSHLQGRAPCTCVLPGPAALSVRAGARLASENPVRTRMQASQAAAALPGASVPVMRWCGNTPKFHDHAHSSHVVMLVLVMLTGHGGGYYGPNMLNMGNTSKREPANSYARDAANWKRAYDETLRLLRAKGGLPQ